MDADDIACANFGSGTLAETAPFGLCGGSGAPPNRQTVHSATGVEETATVNTMSHLSKGQRVEILSSGGGGYGDPLDRTVEQVAADVADGLVSPDAARRDYGVVIDPVTLAADERATARLRSAGRPPRAKETPEPAA